MTTINEEFTERDAAVFIAAMIEGEGHVGCRTTGSTSVRISNTDLFILNRCAEALDVLEVTYNCYGMRYQVSETTTAALLHISHRDNFKRLWEACGGWLVSRKKERLYQLSLTRAPGAPRRAAEYDSRRGRKHLPETRARMSEARKAAWQAGLYDDAFKRREHADVA